MSWPTQSPAQSNFVATQVCWSHKQQVMQVTLNPCLCLVHNALPYFSKRIQRGPKPCGLLDLLPHSGNFLLRKLVLYLHNVERL